MLLVVIESHLSGKGQMIILFNFFFVIRSGVTLFFLFVRVIEQFHLDSFKPQEAILSWPSLKEVTCSIFVYYLNWSPKFLYYVLQQILVAVVQTPVNVTQPLVKLTNQRAAMHITSVHQSDAQVQTGLSYSVHKSIKMIRSFFVSTKCTVLLSK